jgi:hypothetical protein
MRMHAPALQEAAAEVLEQLGIACSDAAWSAKWGADLTLAETILARWVSQHGGGAVAECSTDLHTIEHQLDGDSGCADVRGETGLLVYYRRLLHRPCGRARRPRRPVRAGGEQRITQ